MTMATTTIRIDIDTLPEHLDRSRPSVLSLTLPTCFREFHRARSARGVPG